MTYKILWAVKKGIIVTRIAQIIKGELSVEFDGAPDNATAIFETENGITLFRPLKSGTCKIPADKLSGIIQVSVAVLDGSVTPQKWICEELIATPIDAERTLIVANDLDLHLKLIDLETENEKNKKMLEQLTSRLESIETRIEKMLEGYDLT